MPRLSRTVVQELLDEMNRLVVDYPAGVERTGESVSALIGGTSCFPGGTGLWRGEGYGGPLPLNFPQQPVMFVGHNFDSVDAHARAMRMKGEGKSTFWANLKDFLANAGPLNPTDCFFTNALMGLKPDKPDGTMPDCSGYRHQCQRFLIRQIEIVAPRAIITLGGEAATQLCRAQKLSGIRVDPAFAAVMHPSTRPTNQRPNRQAWLAAQGKVIRDTLARSA
jgi:uracil-DNA glycosylase